MVLALLSGPDRRNLAAQFQESVWYGSSRLLNSRARPCRESITIRFSENSSVPLSDLEGQGVPQNSFVSHKAVISIHRPHHLWTRNALICSPRAATSGRKKLSAGRPLRQTLFDFHLDLQTLFLIHLIHSLPALIRIKCRNCLLGIRRLWPQVLLIHHPVPIDHKRHHARRPVLRRPR